VVIQIKEIENKDISDILCLGKTFYKQDSIDISQKYLEHLYLNNPLGSAIGFFCYQEELLIGFMAIIPVKLINVNKAFYCVNVLTHPLHRSKNIFAKFIDEAKFYLKENEGVLIGHPNRSAFPFWKRKKMIFQNSLVASFKLPNIFKKTRKIVNNNFGPLYSFFDKEQGNQSFVDYDINYFKWRYLGLHKKYNIYAVFKNKEIVGFIVSKNIFFGVDLLIDYGYLKGQKNRVLSSFAKPTIIFSSPVSEINQNSYNLTFLIKKKINYFLTNFSKEKNNLNVEELSLGASDF
jgi:hypothetical protein